MQVFILRHAHAADGADDAARPLSVKGRRQVRRMAAFLKRGERMPAREFWHSPLVRARDTALLLGARLGGEVKLVEVAGLESAANPAIMARRLQKVQRPVVVVGHEPHLSALATLLLTGRTEPPVLDLKKGAVAALERTGRRWALLWLVSPGELG
jgi:phosphohistidine phosphatase